MRHHHPNKTKKWIKTCKVRLIWILLIGLTVVWNSQTMLLLVWNNNNTAATGSLQEPPTTRLIAQSSERTTQMTSTTTTNTVATTTSTSSRYDTLLTCTPSHHACDDFEGLLHIKMGDYGGAGGTIFFQFVIGQLIYAETHNLLPFVHFDNFSHLVYDTKVHGSTQQQPLRMEALQGMQVGTTQDFRWHRALYPGPPEVVSTPLRPHTYILNGTGVWDHYFARVSDYCPGDHSCMQKPYLTMTREHVSPGLHLYAPWAPRIWRYGPLPDFIGQPHLPLKQWLLPQRRVAAQIVQRYFVWQPSLAQQANPKITKECLGLHIRWSDKGASRRIVSVAEFLPFVQEYVKQYQRHMTTNNKTKNPCIYVATDSLPVLEELKSTWPPDIQRHMIHSQASVRSPNETAVFHMQSHHVTNTEVLRDILELSSCGFMVHGKSAVSESAMYLNPNLIYKSIGLEDDDDEALIPTKRTRTVQEFGTMVAVALSGSITEDYWKNVYTPPREWWEDDNDKNTAILLPSSCLQKNTTTTIILSTTAEEPYLSIRQLANRMFVIFWKTLATTDLVVDSAWHYWMVRARPSQLSSGSSSNECHFSRSRSPLAVQEAINRLGTALSSIKGKSLSRLEDFSDIRADADVATRHFMEIRPHIKAHGDSIFNTTAMQRSSCLGLYVSDPGYHKNRNTKEWSPNQYPEESYAAYIEAYIRAGGTCVYLATDSHSIWNRFHTRMNHSTSTCVYTQLDAVRNRQRIPAHYMEERTRRLGNEVLVDVWNLQRCQCIVHSGHVVADVALMQNPQVVSIHVQDPKRMDIPQFLQVCGNHNPVRR